MAACEGKRGENTGLVGLKTPAVVGKSSDHDVPTAVTNVGSSGSTVRAKKLSSLVDPPISVEYFKSATPSPSSLSLASTASCPPFHVRSKASDVVTNVWSRFPVTQ